MQGTTNLSEPSESNLTSINNAEIRSYKGNVHFTPNQTDANTTASPFKAPEDGGSEEDEAKLDWDDE